MPANAIERSVRQVNAIHAPDEDGLVVGLPRPLRAILPSEPGVVQIVAEPGMGKTTALEHLAWKMASAESTNDVPILLPLQDYAGGPFLAWVRSVIRSVGGDSPSALQDMGRVMRVIHRACFFLDGLDEIVPAYREKALKTIYEATDYPHRRQRRVIIATCIEYPLKLPWYKLRKYTLEPISPAQALAYLTEHLGPAQAATLWANLDDALKRLTGIPLLLWLVREFARTAQTTPLNRSALYSHLVAQRLQQDDAQGRGSLIPVKVRLAALDRLGLAMQNAEAVGLPYLTAEEIAGSAAILAGLRVNGLLAGQEVVRFAPHPTFQEHFAARALLPHAEKDAGLLRLWFASDNVLRHVAKRSWAGTYVQVAGMIADPIPVIRALGWMNPLTAWKCWEESRKPTPDRPQAIQRATRLSFQSGKPEERRNAVLTLTKLYSREAIPALTHYSKDNNGGVAAAAIRALFAFGEEGERAFMQSQTERALRLREAKIAWHQEKAALRYSVNNWQKVNAIIDKREADLNDKRLRPELVPGVIDFDWRDGYWCYVPKGIYSFQGQPADIAYDWWIARYPVTYGQMLEFIADPDGNNNLVWYDGLHEEWRHKSPYRASQSFWGSDIHPAITLNWYGAVAFSRWVTVHWKAGRISVPPATPANYQIRLPLETEWEKAASWDETAGKARRYPWGDVFISRYGSISEDLENPGAYYAHLAPAGSYPHAASPCGALDMSGNVWEWCLNEFEGGQVKMASNAPRVLRGGSFMRGPSQATCTSRERGLPNDRLRDYGFRLVLSIPILPA